MLPLSTTLDLSRYPHLHGLQLSDLNILKGQPVDSNIDVLLGADYYFEILTGDIVRGDGGLIAMNSEFGWVVCGPTSNPGADKDVSRVNLLIETQGSLAVPGSLATRNDEPELSKDLRQFWETESLGIQSEEESNEVFLPDIQFNDSEGRYEVTLPWKTDHIPKSSGYGMCMKRLRQLHSRLKIDTPLLREYDTIIKDQEKTGIIEHVVDNNDVEPRHFLPHHAVIRKDKQTTKVRVVFDGSAKSSKDDLSVNDCLDKGPNLVPHLFDTIVKFRGYPVGLIADIEKAFHQIVISPNDRKMLRFLWFDDIYDDYPVIKVYQFCRLPFGLTPSPAVLSTIILHHLSKFKEQEPEVVSLLSESLYIDDFAGGANEDDEAVRIQRTSKHIMNEGGFILRKWYSNSYVRKIIASETHPSSTELSTALETQPCSQPTKPPPTILPEVPSQSPLSVDHHDNPPVWYVKLLGINWNFDSDEFCYNLQEMVEYAQSLPCTKRSVLRLSAKVFDPIGLVTPLTGNMKILFQTLCTNDVKWDDDLEGEALSRWKRLVNELHALQDVRVPRCYFQCIDQLPRWHQLHGFCDASDLALAAAVYLRTEHTNGTVNVNLVASKSRVAPIKKQNTPRLELLGATILARLVKSIVRVLASLKLDLEVILWTDSFTVLCWIRNNRAWKPYVQNRVKEIREITCEYEWRHCPGEYNPADIPSRGCTGNELAKSQLWWNGPYFLTCSRDQWPPELQPTSTDCDQANLETIKNPPLITHSLVGTTSSTNNGLHVDKIINIQRYSTKTKLLRVTARVFRFLRIIRKNLRVSSFELSANELREAENLWILCIHSSCFQEEIRCIHNGCRNAKVNQLGMFINDDHIILCESGINKASVPEHAKQPILLPPRHPLTELILECHKMVHHNGIRDTLNCVRERFWILRGREAVKRIVRKCVTCRRFEGKPIPTPRDPPLPLSRVSDQPPFTHTGIDFPGPLYANTTQKARKVYICLLTCASTRAIHLELVDSLSVPSFLLAFRRFVARRGLPARILTDNAKTFKCAAKEVKNLLRSTNVQRELATSGVAWDYIIERAPWHGGFWGRMVQCMKRCLKKSLGRTSLDFEALRTLLVEIETTINNRPITYVYDDEEGISYPLTPSQLIYGRQIELTPNHRQFAIISSNQSLTKKAKDQRTLLKQFTNRWRKEYLLSIRETGRAVQSKSKESIEVGDVVLKNYSSPRAFWKLASVTELIRSKDNEV